MGTDHDFPVISLITGKQLIGKIVVCPLIL